MQTLRKATRATRKLHVFPTSLIRQRVASFSTPTKGERLIALMDYYADKPAGMWHQLYHARVYQADLFDSGCSDEVGIALVKSWHTMRSYICGLDGLSEGEKEAIYNEINAWCPSLSKQECVDICEQSLDLSADEVQQLCDRINETYPMDARRALLLNSLCGASMDGLSVQEFQGFVKMANRLRVDEKAANEIYDLYKLEVELKQKYDAFYEQFILEMRIKLSFEGIPDWYIDRKSNHVSNGTTRPQNSNDVYESYRKGKFFPWNTTCNILKLCISGGATKSTTRDHVL
eukprot:697092_1